MNDIEFYNSDKPSKRFLAIVGDSTNRRGKKKIYFGQPDAFTYLDGADDKARQKNKE